MTPEGIQHAAGQKFRGGQTAYLSGQIPLNPVSMELVRGFKEQTRQVLHNLQTVARATGGSLDDLVKLNIYLTNLSNFATVSLVMAEFFSQPYPALVASRVASLPYDSEVEMDAIMRLPE